MNLFAQTGFPVTSPGSQNRHKSQAIGKPRKPTKGVEYLKGVLSYVHSHKAREGGALKNNIQANQAVESPGRPQLP